MSADELNIKRVFYWFCLIALMLVAGRFIKDALVVIIGGVFYLSIARGKSHRALYVLIIWYYIRQFYIGQGYFSYPVLYKQLMNILLLTLVLLFHIFWNKKNWRLDKLTVLHFVFLLVFLISAYLNGADLYNSVSMLKYFFLFLIIRESAYDRKVYLTILHIIVAIGLIQLGTSYLQYAGIIERPVGVLYDALGSAVEHTANISDAASGTFGALNSNDTSWFQTLLFLLLLTHGILKNNKGEIVLGGVMLFQYAIIDSKTALGMTGFAVLLLLMEYFRKKEIRLKRILIFVTVAAFIFGGIYSLWNSYYATNYESSVEKSMTDRAEREAGYIVKNFDRWGKVAGFGRIAHGLRKKTVFHLLFGYGVGQYDAWSFERMDYYKMRKSNLLKSRSVFIKIFGETGLMGIILIVLIYFRLYKQINQSEFKHHWGNSYRTVIRPFLLASAVFAFVYSPFYYNSLSIITIWILYGVVSKFEMYNLMGENNASGNS